MLVIILLISTDSCLGVFHGLPRILRMKVSGLPAESKTLTKVSGTACFLLGSPNPAARPLVAPKLRA